MEKLLEKVIVNSINGLYHFYLYDDGNALPKLKVYQVDEEVEIPVKNIYGELIKLNDEFSFQIEYQPKHRSTKFNTREFGNEFIKQFKRK